MADAIPAYIVEDAVSMVVKGASMSTELMESRAYHAEEGGKLRRDL